MSVLVLSEEDLRRILREELRSVLADRPSPKDDRRVTATEAAAAAGVSPATLRQWATDGKVHRYGEGRSQRYSLSEVLELSAFTGRSTLTMAERADAIMRKHHG